MYFSVCLLQIRRLLSENKSLTNAALKMHIKVLVYAVAAINRLMPGGNIDFKHEKETVVEKRARKTLRATAKLCEARAPTTANVSRC